MREYKFRGKRKDNGEWVYGYYFIEERDIEDGIIWRDIPQIQQPEFCEIIDLIQTIKHQQQKIETQRQEIEKLKATLADWKYNAKCDADHIAALTADKDEQARKTRQLEEGLRSTLKVLETLNYRSGLGLDIHKWLRDEMQTVNALIGGKEDE